MLPFRRQIMLIDALDPHIFDARTVGDEEYIKYLAELFSELTTIQLNLLKSFLSQIKNTQLPLEIISDLNNKAHGISTGRDHVLPPTSYFSDKIREHAVPLNLGDYPGNLFLSDIKFLNPILPTILISMFRAMHTDKVNQFLHKKSRVGIIERLNMLKSIMKRDMPTYFILDYLEDGSLKNIFGHFSLNYRYSNGVTDPDVVVGFAIYDPENHSKGYGGKVVMEIISQVRYLFEGARNIVVETDKRNLKIQSLVKKMGFEMIDTRLDIDIGGKVNRELQIWEIPADLFMVNLD